MTGEKYLPYDSSKSRVIGAHISARPLRRRQTGYTQANKGKHKQIINEHESAGQHKEHLEGKGARKYVNEQAAEARKRHQIDQRVPLHYAA